MGYLMKDFCFSLNISGFDYTTCNFPQKVDSLEDIDFVECGHEYIICKDFRNDIYVWGDNNEGQLGLGTRNKRHKPIKCDNWPNDIVDIKCGYFHTLVLTSNRE